MTQGLGRRLSRHTLFRLSPCLPGGVFRPICLWLMGRRPKMQKPGSQAGCLDFLCGTGTLACDLSKLNLPVDRRRPRLRFLISCGTGTLACDPIDTRVAQHRGPRRMRFLHLLGWSGPRLWPLTKITSFTATNKTRIYFTTTSLRRNKKICDPLPASREQPLRRSSSPLLP